MNEVDILTIHTDILSQFRMHEKKLLLYRERLNQLNKNFEIK